MTPLQFSYDAVTDTMIIEGKKFSGEFLRFLASSPPIGVKFVVNYSDGDCIGFEVFEEKRV